jgi:hypothetical protein
MINTVNCDYFVISCILQTKFKISKINTSPKGITYSSEKPLCPERTEILV